MVTLKRTAFTAALVGAISLSPTGLLPADALVIAKANSASGTVTSALGKVVAGANSTSSASGVFTTTPNVSTCVVSSTLFIKANNNATTIMLDSVDNLYIGTVIATTTGITPGTTITGINSGAKSISISQKVTSTIAADTSLSFLGCYQSYFYVNNVGGISIKSFGISQTVSAGSPEVVTLQSCSTSWISGACPSGLILDIVSTTNATSSIIQMAIPLAAGGGSIQLRAVSNIPNRTSQISIIINSSINFRNGVTNSR